MTSIAVADTPADLHRLAAAQFTRLSADAIDERGVFTVALSGGSTPRGVYRMLAEDPTIRSQVSWQRIEFFWSDERHVPPDHPDSNYGMAHEALLSRVAVAARQMHRIHAEYPNATVAAQQYEEEIRNALKARTTIPQFDLMLLGLGEDGHTASLFPGTAALAERERLCVANRVPTLGVDRITMTLPLLNAARVVAFIVGGAEKATIVRDVLRSGESDRRFPAQLVQPASGQLLWLLDRDAASLLGDARS